MEYFSAPSYSDEFGDAITGDFTIVQVSFIVAFVGLEVMWERSDAVLVLVGPWLL